MESSEAVLAIEAADPVEAIEPARSQDAMLSDEPADATGRTLRRPVRHPQRLIVRRAADGWEDVALITTFM